MLAGCAEVVDQHHKTTEQRNIATDPSPKRTKLDPVSPAKARSSILFRQRYAETLLLLAFFSSFLLFRQIVH